MSEQNTAKNDMVKCEQLEAQIAELATAKTNAEKALADAQASLKAMQDTYAAEKAEAEKQMAKMKEDKEMAEKQLAEAVTSAKELAGSYEKAKAEILDYKAVARLNEMKSFGAVDGKDDAKSLELFKAMSDDAYNAAKTVAVTMFKKATESTVTSNPKSTEQGVTSFTQSTKAAEELEKVEASAESNVTLETASTKVSVKNEAIEKFVSNILKLKA
jgi:hypothetical protein